MTRAVHVLVFDGFADWEPSFALAEVRRSGGLDVATVGFSSAPVRSMGGLRVLPDRVLGEIDPTRVRLLILPGGDMWEAGEYPRAELEAFLARVTAVGVPIAGICGATVALARAGLLTDRLHTSNGRAFLAEAAAGYGGEAHYQEALAVRDRGVITASGAAPVEFAREVFAELEVFSASDLQLWFEIFKTGHVPAPGA